jgi:glycosyltransferase involved in cell wall biosynthesis
MRCPRLDELPDPPPMKVGWPCTEESQRLPSRTSDDRPWPRISLITPSFNQGAFIEETIRSVLLQGYPNLEYFVMDGGSTDNSVAVIKKYSPWLTYWVSERDNGQSDAINRGMKMASGDFATWINSDDLLCKNALTEHATRIGFDANTVYLGICVYIDQARNFLSSHHGRVTSLEDLVRVGTVWRSGGQIVQPEVLFPRELAIAVGGLNSDNHFTMDYELWGKLLLAGAKFQHTRVPFGMFREHPLQKIHDVLRTTESLLETAAKLIRLGDCFSEETKRDLLADLDAYRVKYHKDYWKGSGRLARIGLPRELVTHLRNLKTALLTLI